MQLNGNIELFRVLGKMQLHTDRLVAQHTYVYRACIVFVSLQDETKF